MSFLMISNFSVYYKYWGNYGKTQVKVTILEQQFCGKGLLKFAELVQDLCEIQVNCGNQV